MSRSGYQFKPSLLNNIKLANNSKLYYYHQDDAMMLMSTSVPQFYDTPPYPQLSCKSVSK